MTKAQIVQRLLDTSVISAEEAVVLLQSDVVSIPAYTPNPLYDNPSFTPPPVWCGTPNTTS